MLKTIGFLMLAGSILGLGAEATAQSSLPGFVCSEHGGVGCHSILEDRHPGGETSSFTVRECDVVTGVNVGLLISHGWTGDLRVRLTAPDGTRVMLLDRPDIDASLYGCPFANIDTILDDDATAAASSACTDDQGQTVPSIAGSLRPLEPLAALNGRNGNGRWALHAADFATENTGALLDWSLELECSLKDVDVILSKEVTPASANPGETVVYTLAVTNAGSETARRVEVVDDLPAKITFVEATCPGLIIGNDFVWRIGNLEPAENATCDLTASVDSNASGVITNTASVTSLETDTSPADNTAVVSSSIGLFADDFESGATERWSASIGGR